MNIIISLMCLFCLIFNTQISSTAETTQRTKTIPTTVIYSICTHSSSFNISESKYKFIHYCIYKFLYQNLRKLLLREKYVSMDDLYSKSCNFLYSIYLMNPCKNILDTCYTKKIMELTSKKIEKSLQIYFIKYAKIEYTEIKQRVNQNVNNFISALVDWHMEQYKLGKLDPCEAEMYYICSYFTINSLNIVDFYYPDYMQTLVKRSFKLDIETDPTIKCCKFNIINERSSILEYLESTKTKFLIIFDLFFYCIEWFNSSLCLKNASLKKFDIEVTTFVMTISILAFPRQSKEIGFVFLESVCENQELNYVTLHNKSLLKPATIIQMTRTLNTAINHVIAKANTRGISIQKYNDEIQIIAKACKILILKNIGIYNLAKIIKTPESNEQTNPIQNKVEIKKTSITPAISMARTNTNPSLCVNQVIDDVKIDNVSKMKKWKKKAKNYVMPKEITNTDIQNPIKVETEMDKKSEESSKSGEILNLLSVKSINSSSFKQENIFEETKVMHISSSSVDKSIALTNNLKNKSSKDPYIVKKKTPESEIKWQKKPITYRLNELRKDLIRTDDINEECKLKIKIDFRPLEQDAYSNIIIDEKDNDLKKLPTSQLVDITKENSDVKLSIGVSKNNNDIVTKKKLPSVFPLYREKEHGLLSQSTLPINPNDGNIKNDAKHPALSNKNACAEHINCLPINVVKKDQNIPELHKDLFYTGMNHKYPDDSRDRYPSSFVSDTRQENTKTLSPGPTYAEFMLTQKINNTEKEVNIFSNFDRNAAQNACVKSDNAEFILRSEQNAYTETELKQEIAKQLDIYNITREKFLLSRKIYKEELSTLLYKMNSYLENKNLIIQNKIICQQSSEIKNEHVRADTLSLAYKKEKYERNNIMYNPGEVRGVKYTESSIIHDSYINEQLICDYNHRIQQLTNILRISSESFQTFTIQNDVNIRYLRKQLDFIRIQERTTACQRDDSEKEQ